MDTKLREAVTQIEMRERSFYRKGIMFLSIGSFITLVIGVILFLVSGGTSGGTVLGLFGVYVGVLYTVIAAKLGSSSSITILKLLLIRIEQLEHSINKVIGDK